MNTENSRDVGGRRFRHHDLTDRVVGVFYDVYGELGYGFLESVYRTAMTMALREAGLRVTPEIKLQAQFRRQPIGWFRADLLIEDVVLIELKATREIDSTHIAQLLNYLRCTALETGLILNFGPRPQIRRLIFTNDRKNRVHVDTS
jgi:GxxExxY protein